MRVELGFGTLETALASHGGDVVYKQFTADASLLAHLYDWGLVWSGFSCFE